MTSPALARLIAGFKGFRARYFEQRPELYESFAKKGQSPEVLIVGCSDSRADPAILLSAEPGELFIIRNVANLVPPYQPDGHYHGTSSALEFAVRDLTVRHIVVLGHSGCGGIEALAKSGLAPEQREFIAGWVSIAEKARQGCAHAGRGAGGRDLEQASIRVSLENLLTFPWIRERVQSGKLALHGWWFDLGEGELWGLDSPDEEFRILS
jgi:carbonic anhydrase